MNYSNHLVTKEYRQLLRKAATPSERMIWKRLQKRQIDGYKFRQQHGMGPYVLDFYCPELRLCIEVDGDIHDLPENKEKDRERTIFLNQNRIEVIRFRNEEINENIEDVINRIKEKIEEIHGKKQLFRPPTP